MFQEYRNETLSIEQNRRVQERNISCGFITVSYFASIKNTQKIIHARYPHILFILKM